MRHHSRLSTAHGFCLGLRALLALGLVAAAATAGAHPRDYSVMLNAQVSAAQPRIELQWPVSGTATQYLIDRRLFGTTNWARLAELGAAAATSTGWTDTAVAPGTTYEYQVRRASGSNQWASGYALSAIARPLPDTRGMLLLIVDRAQAGPLSNELVRLQRDLVGDGWTVVRHDIEGKHWSDPGWKEAVTNLKALIRADYEAAPTQVSAVFLLGHVAVPYSGRLAPDGHGEHRGAWPADLYYGDLHGTWTDTQVTWTNNGPRLQNVPGDGKFDQTTPPAPVDLQVGRVDFRDLPCFAGKSETELLRQYLDKDHEYRMRRMAAQPRGLVDDNFGDFHGEAFAADGWRNFGNLFGPSNVVEADWFGTLATNDYQWAYGCGPGGTEGCGGVGSSADFASHDPRVVFTMLFGSYFGDWDQPNDFLRAALGAATYTLSCSWGGRPYNYYHLMTLGGTLGECMRWTQALLPTDQALEDEDEVPRPHRRPHGRGRRGGVHVALMGDPTLRLHIVAPATQLNGVKSGRRTRLEWVASTDTNVAGYHVYRAAAIMGPYTRLTEQPVAATRFTDRHAPAQEAAYMVRPVRLEVSRSGSYWNMGQGAFVVMGAKRNHAPVATDLTLTTAEDTALPIALVARDEDGDPLTWFLAGRPRHGTVTGTPPNLVYQPASDYFGPDHFGFQVNDGRAESTVASVSLTVTPVNDAPVARPQTLMVAQDTATPIALQATDADGDRLTYTLDEGPSHGTVSGQPPAAVYTPAAGYVGPDKFTFHAGDGLTHSAAAAVSITVLPLRPPDNPGACTNGVGFEEYRGSWTSLPDFGTLTPSRTGTAAAFTLSAASTNENYALRYRGYVRAPTNGLYTFYTSSDDGSRLYIGTNVVVNNDGIHAPQEGQGQLALGAGLHAITVTFFQGPGGQALDVSWEGPGLPKQAIPEAALFRALGP